MTKKTASIVLSIVFVLSLTNIIMAKEIISLNIDQIVKQVFNKPPVTSSFSRFIFGVEKKPTKNLSGLLTPDVSFEIRDNLVNGYVRNYNCYLNGDLSNFFTIKDYEEYYNLLEIKYEVKKKDSQIELMLNIIYPYLTLAELNQNLEIIEEYKQEFYNYYNYLQKNLTYLQIDPLLLKQVEAFYANFNLLEENNEREYESFKKEMLFLLGKHDEKDLDFKINDSLKSFQEKYLLNHFIGNEEMKEIVNNHPDVQIAQLDLEIERLARKKRFYDKFIPDLNYNISYQHNYNGEELNWSISANWNLEFLFSGADITLDVNQNSRSFRIDFNQIDDNSVNNPNLVELNESNVKANRYIVERKFTEITNRIKERDSIMKITETNIEILSGQIERLRQKNNPENYIQLMKLIYDYVNAKISYNSQYKSYLYSQFQIQLALGKINFE